MKKIYSRPTTPIKENMRKPYVTVSYTLSKSTIGKFIRPKWHRDFKNDHINRIKASIMRGVHFSENITVNELETSYNVLNGNHRIESVRQIIASNPSFRIEVSLTKYKGLSYKSEVEIYDKVNNTRRETALDRLKAHCIGSLAVKRFSKFPLTVMFRNASYSDANSLPATTVFYPYILRKTQCFSGGYIRPEMLNALNDEDIDRVIDYFSFYKSVFGEFTRKNTYCNKALISIVAKIYYNNVGVDISKTQLAERLKKIMRQHTGSLQMLMSQGAMHKELYIFLISRLKSRKKLYNILDEVQPNDQN